MPFPFPEIIPIHPKRRAELYTQHLWRLPIKYGKEMFSSSLVIQPQQQSQHLEHNRKQKNTE